MPNQEITLNIRYDIPASEWQKISDVYKSMDGWLESEELPQWYGTEHDAQYILASVEPGGIQFAGCIDNALWMEWITTLCARLSLTLGREIHDTEM